MGSLWKLVQKKLKLFRVIFLDAVVDFLVGMDLNDVRLLHLFWCCLNLLKGILILMVGRAE
ncbi:hypothetical protein GV64_19095 [Endozoicomonas elysicola]|uniref:Uncharacterized protein n=1 Tax=Endozoicomonas elysicola TaxID=305900 RepID=A0A081KEH8_9GAMM|nr:hypothetical protein GV64_19095 [Endozoicomonas elysicola]